MAATSVMQLQVSHTVDRAPPTLHRAMNYKARIVRTEVVQEGNFMRMLVHWSIYKHERKAANDTPKKAKKDA